jgi:gamma-glutamyl-gamma-aminobutyraldehyde dehydrogenase
LAPEERKRTLLRLADLLEADAEHLAELDAREAGKPITDCRETDIPETVKTFRWYAEAIDKLFDSVAPTGPSYLGLIVREPIGVVGAVLPWNFPAMMAAWKVAPALAAGNSVIVKPAELTSLSALRIAELAAEAGMPEGVFNVVPGLGETAGQALGRHSDIDMVSFTGSTEVGRLFLRYAAESNLKRVVLECGGKSPQIVLADAPDLEIVADDVLAAGYWNMGENCTCGSRLIVHRSIKDELLDLLVRGLDQWPVGDPLDPATKIGPMIEEDHLNKVLTYLDSGQADGATVVAGGGRVLDDTGGYFVAPTIFDDVDNRMRIAREEIFGPVIATIPFDSEAEAVSIANDTNYGLAASLWTTNIDSAFRVARAIKAGTVSVNCYSEGDVTTPFGGYKESGFGGRDNGLEAFDQYTETKTVWIATR